jgi:hypothetical protein
VTPALSGEYVTEAILARFAAIRPSRPVIYVDAKPRRQRQPRRPSIARMLKLARKAGFNIAGATIAADGSVVLTFGAGGADERNAWDEVLSNGPH